MKQRGSHDEDEIEARLAGAQPNTGAAIRDESSGAPSTRPVRRTRARPGRPFVFEAP